MFVNIENRVYTSKYLLSPCFSTLFELLFFTVKGFGRKRFRLVFTRTRFSLVLLRYSSKNLKCKSRGFLFRYLFV